MSKKKSALAKLKLPSKVRSDLFLALVKRISEHGEFKGEAGFAFASGKFEHAARIMECVDIAHEIGNEEERAMLSEIRNKRDRDA